MEKITSNTVVKIVKNSPWLIQRFNGLPFYLLNTGGKSIWGKWDALTKKFVGTNYRHYVINGQGNRAAYLYDERDLANIGRGFFKKITGLKQLRKWISLYKRDYLATRKKTGNVAPRLLKVLSLKKLIQLTKELSFELAASVSFSHAIEGISFVSEMKLKEILNKRSSFTNESYQLLSSPLKPSFLAQAQTLLWKIKYAPKGKKSRLLDNFLANFSWIDTSYVQGKTFTKKEALNKAKQQKHLPSLDVYTKTKAEKNKLTKMLQLTKQELFIVQTIEAVIVWQDERKKIILQSVNRFEPIIREIAQRVGITAEEMKYICPHEITYKNLTNKNFLQDLTKRFQHTTYYLLKNRIIPFSGKTSILIEKGFRRNNNKVVAELSGTVANKGLAKGRVRKISNIYDIPKVKKGEILVASMTRPEFFPAMQKAAAFITDEGGITSHAAIVSREMNKPCIIGTKIATEIFKNGDFVEVDANKGIVKKIK